MEPVRPSPKIIAGLDTDFEEMSYKDSKLFKTKPHI